MGGAAHLRVCLAITMVFHCSVAIAQAPGSPRKLLQATQPSGSVHPRIEINEIDKRPQSDRYRNLLILAWRRIQDTDSSDPESNFQLSGIHGAPYTAYNGSIGAGSSTGYCYHSSVLFPTWHRPYTVQFERVLIKRAAEVANSFVNETERAEYAALAPTIRLPYWDWANPYNENGDFPQLFITTTVTVVDPTSPDAATITIDNPLYQYILPEPVFGGGPWPSTITRGQATVRDPDNTGSYSSNERGFVQAIQGNAATFAYHVFNLLGAGTWECLYNGNCGLGAVDLESIHNSVHGVIGGNMGVVPTSGFDPIFWMHHAQIDRIFWLWQQRWPDVWLPPTYERAGNFYTPGGQTFDANTELAPFWRDANGYFTSNDCRSIEALGYTYQPPAGGDPNPNNPPPPAPPLPQRQEVTTGFSTGVTSRFSAPSSFSFFGRRRLQASGSVGSASSVTTAAKAKKVQPRWKEAMRVYSHGYSSYRWQVNFAGVDKQQLGQPFYIRLFVAKLHKNGTSTKHGTFKASGYCGSHYQLSATNRTRHALATPTVDITIDVTHCLHRAGFNTTFAAKVAGQPAAGPAGAPAGLQHFVWDATTRDGADVSKKFNFGTPKLSWTVMVDGRLHVGTA